MRLWWWTCLDITYEWVTKSSCALPCKRCCWPYLCWSGYVWLPRSSSACYSSSPRLWWWTRHTPGSMWCWRCSLQILGPHIDAQLNEPGTTTVQCSSASSTSSVRGPGSVSVLTC